MLFILGIERSATTWISNLLDAHSAVRVYVEPMSLFTTRFKQWPSRVIKIDNLAEKATYFTSELEILKKRQSWLLTRFIQSKIAWKFDLKLADFLIRKKLASEEINDFYEINFHRKNLAYSKYKSNAPVEAVKELRLNFNAGIIPYIDPEARVIVVIRDMPANIQSILTHIKEGGLAELKQLLLVHYGRVDEESVFKYWRDSYNTLLYQLEKDETAYLTVLQNDLIQNPEQTIKKICDFIKLDKPDSILHYFHHSNKEGEGIHNTKRNHKTLLQRNRKAREEVYPKIKELLEVSDLHPVLQRVVL